jgi:hypothetical protein
MFGGAMGTLLCIAVGLGFLRGIYAALAVVALYCLLVLLILLLDLGLWHVPDE